ncbi:MAG TPA: phosphatidate cytidylyltransferase [Candidatus Gracilibacteria bacterium]|nr:phosphatidate cytidylyltransferase [Candidatus Gracilibacteria bacterium]
MGHSLKKEILRKLLHLTEVPLLVAYSFFRYYWSERAAIIALTACLLVLLEIEYIRLEVKPKIPKMFNLFRAREKNNVTGMVFFIAATIIAFGAFDYEIALLALLMTVFGDLVSALVGIKFGKHRLFRKKTWEGFLSGLFMNLIVGYLMFPAIPTLFVSMAVVASVVELMTNKLDDNITVPLFAGFTGQMFVYFLSIPLTGFPGPLSGIFTLLSP